MFVLCLLGPLVVSGSAGAWARVVGTADRAPSSRLGGLTITAISPNTGVNGSTVTCAVSGTFTPLNGDLVGAPVFSLEQGTTTIRGTTQDWSAVTGSAHVSFVLPATAPGGSYLLLATQKTTFGEAVGALDDAFTISPKYPLLILADKSFLRTLAPLVRFKDASGMPTTLRSWQSFQAQYVSQAKTVQERIKRGIADYYQTYGTRYVMLVGNGDKFPMAWITGEGSRGKIDNYTSIDLYYACLFKKDGTFDDWDGNANGYIGQVRFNTLGKVNQDDVNPTPSVGLARIPASTVAQVTTYVQKVIAYECGSYEHSWTGNAALLAASNWTEGSPWPGSAIGMSDAYASQYLAGLTITKLYSGRSPDLTPGNFQSALNSGQLLVSYLGHGYINGSGLAFPGNDGYTIGSMSGVGGVSLQNADRLPVIFSGGCNTEQYANWPGARNGDSALLNDYVDVHGVTHLYGAVLKGVPPKPAPVQPHAFLPGLAFGESMLLNGRSGAIAYLGATVFSQFQDEIGACFLWEYAQGDHVLGDMWRDGVAEWYVFYVPDPGTAITVTDAAMKNTKFIQPWKFDLLGDPSLRIGGVAPAAPQNAALPVVNGTPARGAVLTCASGAWTGCPYPSLHCQWRRNGVAIAGATTPRHVVVPADYGTMLSCVVTATNASGSATAESEIVSVTGNSPDLVLNGGAEVGTAAPDGSTIVPPEKWKTTGAFTAVAYGATGGFPDATVSTAIDGGTAFFAGGNAAVSTATQTHTVPAAWRSWVKLGFVKGVLSADLGGWGDQEDDATVTAVFLNKSGHTLKSLKIGPVTEAQRQGQTTLLLRSKSVAVPPKTAKVRLVITATGAGGAYNDGYADNVVFVLHR